MELAEVRILLIGVEEKAVELIRPLCAGAIITTITSADVFGAGYEQWTDESYNLIVCGIAIPDLSSNEMAQVLVNQCPNTFKYFITCDTSNYEPRILIKNGFTSAFAFPVDLPLFKKQANENVFAAARKERSFRTVRVLDLGSGDELGFRDFHLLPEKQKTYSLYFG